MRESGCQNNRTHNPCEESHRVSRLKENLTIFRWIKQNQCIKGFLGTSFNAAMAQLLVALCVYQVLAFLKFQSKLRHSL